MSAKLENAKRLYLEGIRDGRIEVVRELSGARYTQHSSGVADGATGFEEFFKGFLERTKKRDIRVIRAIEDGSFVFLHVFQDIDDGAAKWVTTDMFDTDGNDKMIEHWDVISPYKEPTETVSGNDVILGRFDILDLDKTELNKARVRSFLTEVCQNGALKAISNYIPTRGFIQHGAALDNGIDPIEAALSSGDLKYDFIFKVIGQGNFVVSYSKAIVEGQEQALFEIFRLENGMIVERWENMEPIPPREEWANTGKF